jgi:uncharacterized protein YggE
MKQHPLIKILIAVCCTLNFACRADERPLDTLTVTGKSSVLLTANIAEIYLGVEVNSRTAKEVQDSLSKKQNRVLSVLRAEGADKVITQSLMINPRYDQDNSVKVIGYIGEATIKFSTPAARAGLLIDAAIQAGANTTQGIVMKPLESEIKEARAKALKDASNNAIQEGKLVLDSLELSFRQVKLIDIFPDYSQATYLPNNSSYAMQSTKQHSQVEVTPGEVNIQASVKLTIEYQ